MESVITVALAVLAALALLASVFALRGARALSGRLDQFDRRIDALGSALGVHASETGRRLDALGGALGVHANETGKRLDALGNASGGESGSRLDALGNALRMHANDTSNRLEALGNAFGVYANDTGNRLDSLTDAFSAHATSTDNRLEALAAASRALTQQTNAIEQRASDIRVAVALTQMAVYADSLAELLAPFDWAGAIAEASRRRPEPMLAQIFLQRRKTGSQPVDLRCADGNVYIVKGPWNGRSEQDWLVFVEYLVGRLGRLIGAPVPEVAVVSVPSVLIAQHPDPHHGLGHLRPGEAHGLRHIDGLDEHCGEIKHVDANRERFASLAILNAWTQATDRQFLYESQPPHRVYSTDHGRYLDNKPGWCAGDMLVAAQTHLADDIIASCGLTHEELVAAMAPLGAATAPQLAEILASPPDSWGVDLEQRATIGRNLRLRQFHLLALYGPVQAGSRRLGR